METLRNRKMELQEESEEGKRTKGGKGQVSVSFHGLTKGQLKLSAQDFRAVLYRYHSFIS